MEHNVAHTAASAGCYGDDVQIAVMLRSDLFRESRARRIDACPGPKELFRIVNKEVAQHLATVPCPLPNIEDVMAQRRLGEGADAEPAGEEMTPR